MADNITQKNTIKTWFKRGLKPTEVQFHAWIDSYWHKSESIPTATIEGLENILNNKAESADTTSIREEIGQHLQDNTRHKTASEQSKLDNLAKNPNLTYATNIALDDLETYVDEQDAAGLQAAKDYTDALAGNVYKKAETYTRTEVDNKYVLKTDIPGIATNPRGSGNYISEIGVNNANRHLLEVSYGELPVALKNPNAITFTGAVSASYDGSVAKTINIPNSWNEVTGKPAFATVATSGNYNDLVNKPAIPVAETPATVMSKINSQAEITFTKHVVCTNGAGTASTSDIRFKKNVYNLRNLLPVVADAPLFNYTWKNEPDILIGSSAQYWEQYLPELVYEMEDGTKTLSYERLGGVVALKAIQEEYALRIKENKELRDKLEKLEKSFQDLLNKKL